MSIIYFSPLPQPPLSQLFHIRTTLSPPGSFNSRASSTSFRLTLKCTKSNTAQEKFPESIPSETASTYSQAATNNAADLEFPVSFPQPYRALVSGALVFSSLMSGLKETYEFLNVTNKAAKLAGLFVVGIFVLSLCVWTAWKRRREEK